MREVDDKIIYALNTSLPTESFKGQANATDKCKELYNQLHKIHDSRAEVIKNCISKTAERVKELKSKPEDMESFNTFKAEQRKLRLLRSELSVEDIVKQRTYKTFHERCRPYYTDENLA